MPEVLFERADMVAHPALSHFHDLCGTTETLRAGHLDKDADGVERRPGPDATSIRNAHCRHRFTHDDC